jgi:hypothetical protein
LKKLSFVDDTTVLLIYFVMHYNHFTISDLNAIYNFLRYNQCDMSEYADVTKQSFNNVVTNTCDLMHRNEERCGTGTTSLIDYEVPENDGTDDIGTAIIRVVVAIYPRDAERNFAHWNQLINKTLEALLKERRDVVIQAMNSTANMKEFRPIVSSEMFKEFIVYRFEQATKPEHRDQISMFVKISYDASKRNPVVDIHQNPRFWDVVRGKVVQVRHHTLAIDTVITIGKVFLKDLLLINLEYYNELVNKKIKEVIDKQKHLRDRLTVWDGNTDLCEIFIRSYIYRDHYEGRSVQRKVPFLKVRACKCHEPTLWDIMDGIGFDARQFGVFVPSVTKTHQKQKYQKTGRQFFTNQISFLQNNYSLTISGVPEEAMQLEDPSIRDATIFDGIFNRKINGSNDFLFTDISIIDKGIGKWSICTTQEHKDTAVKAVEQFAKRLNEWETFQSLSNNIFQKTVPVEVTVLEINRIDIGIHALETPRVEMSRNVYKNSWGVSDQSRQLPKKKKSQHDTRDISITDRNQLSYVEDPNVTNRRTAATNDGPDVRDNNYRENISRADFVNELKYRYQARNETKSNALPVSDRPTNTSVVPTANEKLHVSMVSELLNVVEELRLQLKQEQENRLNLKAAYDRETFYRDEAYQQIEAETEELHKAHALFNHERDVQHKAHSETEASLLKVLELRHKNTLSYQDQDSVDQLIQTSTDN